MTIKVCFVKYAESQRARAQGGSDVWVTKPFQNRKKVILKMKAHAGSETTSDAEALGKKRRINRTLLTMCWGIREKQELKGYQVISWLYSFPM